MWLSPVIRIYNVVRISCLIIYVYIYTFEIFKVAIILAKQTLATNVYLYFLLLACLLFKRFKELTIVIPFFYVLLLLFWTWICCVFFLLFLGRVWNLWFFLFREKKLFVYLKNNSNQRCYFYVLNFFYVSDIILINLKDWSPSSSSNITTTGPSTHIQSASTKN